MKLLIQHIVQSLLGGVGLVWLFSEPYYGLMNTVLSKRIGFMGFVVIGTICGVTWFFVSDEADRLRSGLRSAPRTSPGSGCPCLPMKAHRQIADLVGVAEDNNTPAIHAANRRRAIAHEVATRILMGEFDFKTDNDKIY